MAEENFMSFDETMERLSLTEEQLMEEVAANRLRSYMKDREMHFKKEDVETVAANRELAAIPPQDMPQDSGEIILIESGNETVEEKPVELVSQEEDSDIDINPDSSEIELLSISENKENEAAKAAAAPPPPPAKTDTETDSDEIIFADEDISFNLDETNIGGGIEAIEDTDILDAEESSAEVMDISGVTSQTEVIEADEFAPSLEQPAVSLASMRSESAKSGMVAHRAPVGDVATLWYALLIACLVFAIIPLTALLTATFQDTPLLIRGEGGKIITDSSGTFIPEPLSTLNSVLGAKNWWGAPRIEVPKLPPKASPSVAKKETPAAPDTAVETAAETQEDQESQEGQENAEPAEDNQETEEQP